MLLSSLPHFILIPYLNVLLSQISAHHLIAKSSDCSHPALSSWQCFVTYWNCSFPKAFPLLCISMASCFLSHCSPTRCFCWPPDAGHSLKILMQLLLSLLHTSPGQALLLSGCELNAWVQTVRNHFSNLRHVACSFFSSCLISSLVT